MGDDANGGFGRGCAEAPAPRLQSEVQRPAALTPLERGKCTAHLKQDMATEARVLPLVRCQDGFAHNTICITVAWLPTQGSCHLFDAKVGVPTLELAKPPNYPRKHGPGTWGLATTQRPTPYYSPTR